MAEIKLSYLAQSKGLIGPSPQKINKNESCVFTCEDSGSFEVEFVNGSPTNDDTTKFNKKGPGFVAHKSGRFKFQCTFISPDGKKVVVGAPGDPTPGGEIEIG
jgi:hypothetical protein